MILLGIWAPASAFAEVTADDHRGNTLVLASPPQRIVSLVPSFTESVCALGGCERLVGTDQFSNAPPEVLRLPKLGGLEDTQVERIALLKPDLVLAAPFTRVTGRLERLGLKVLVIEFQTHAGVRQGLHQIARVLGTPAQAELLWERVERDMRAAAELVPPTQRGRRVYFEVEGSAHAAGPVSFIGETLSRLGLRNVVDRDMGPFPKLNPEFVVRAQPDIIIVSDDLAPEALMRRPGWRKLQALRSNQLCAFPRDRYEVLVRPGPRIGEAALAIAQCLAGLPAVRGSTIP